MTTHMYLALRFYNWQKLCLENVGAPPDKKNASSEQFLNILKLVKTWNVVDHFSNNLGIYSHKHFLRMYCNCRSVIKIN